MNEIDELRLQPQARAITRAALQRALAVVNQSKLACSIDPILDSGPGRPRRLPIHALLVLSVLTATEFDGRQHMTNTAKIVFGLTKKQQRLLRLPTNTKYQDIARAATTLATATQPTMDVDTGEILADARLPFSMHELTNSLLRGSFPQWLTPTNTIAIDSTDVETWAARKSRSTIPGSTKATSVSPTDFPGIGPDNRLQHTLDRDARDGFRTGKQLQHRNIFHGYDLHIATDVVQLGDTERRPAFVRAINLTAAGSSKTTAGLDLVDYYDTHWAPVSTVISDRGYTHGVAGKWAAPLAERFIEQLLDIHPSDLGTKPGPVAGTIICDGATFTNALPPRLRELRRPSQSATSAERARRAKEFDGRQTYALVPYGPRHANGSRRYRGPALTGRLRCPNTPSSMLGPATVPVSSCIKGEACGCGVTVTLGAETLKLRQRWLYGTTKWAAAYFRRVAVESANANIREHHANLKRGAIRVIGRVKTCLMVACQVIAANLRLAKSRYEVVTSPITKVTSGTLRRRKKGKKPPKPALHTRVFGRPLRPPLRLGEEISPTRRTDHD